LAPPLPHLLPRPLSSLFLQTVGFVPEGTLDEASGRCQRPQLFPDLDSEHAYGTGDAEHPPLLPQVPLYLRSFDGSCLPNTMLVSFLEVRVASPLPPLYSGAGRSPSYRRSPSALLATPVATSQPPFFRRLKSDLLATSPFLRHGPAPLAPHIIDGPSWSPSPMPSSPLP